MAKILLGAALFGLPHMLAILFPAARDGLKARLGEGPFKGLYALFSLAGLALLASAYLDTGSGQDMLYQPWEKGKHLFMLMVLAGFILMAAAHGKGHMRLAVRHPMSAGVALWAAAHLLANGERPVVWLFGMLLVVALADIAFSIARGKGPSYVPQASSDVKAVVAGTLLYLVFLFGFHPYVLGVPVI